MCQWYMTTASFKGGSFSYFCSKQPLVFPRQMRTSSSHQRVLHWFVCTLIKQLRTYLHIPTPHRISQNATESKCISYTSMNVHTTLQIISLLLCHPFPHDATDSTPSEGLVCMWTVIGLVLRCHLGLLKVALRCHAG